MQAGKRPAIRCVLIPMDAGRTKGNTGVWKKREAKSLDREEYHQKLDELTGLVKKKDYEGALAVVEEIDWRRVKSINTLNMVADVYEVNRKYEQAKKILVLAHDRAPIGRGILYRLVELCIKLGDLDDAERYFKEFTNTAKNDNSRCILQYKLYKAKKAPLEAQIDVLEEYREREYTERWAYELAVLYAKAGDTRKCVDACDDLILWFSEGKYVYKALELKKRYEALTPSQEQAYAKMEPDYRRENRGRDYEGADDYDETAKDASDRAAVFAARSARAAAERAAAETGRQETAAQADSAALRTGSGAARAQAAENASTDDFRNRIARSFRNVFALNDEEEDGIADAEAAEAAEDQAKLNRSIDAEQKYVSQNGMKLRNLEEEQKTVTVDPFGSRNSKADDVIDQTDTADSIRAAEIEETAERKEETKPESGRGSAAPEQKRREQTAANREKKSLEDLDFHTESSAEEQSRYTQEESDQRMNTADFDLDAFLAEMQGSFKAEMEDEAREAQIYDGNAEEDSSIREPETADAGSADTADTAGQMKEYDSSEDNEVPEEETGISGTDGTAEAEDAADAEDAEESGHVDAAEESGLEKSEHMETAEAARTDEEIEVAEAAEEAGGIDDLDLEIREITSTEELASGGEVEGAEQIMSVEEAAEEEPEIHTEEPADDAIAAALDAIVAAAEADAADTAVELGISIEPDITETADSGSDDSASEEENTADGQKEEKETKEDKSMADNTAEEKRTPHYNEELEIPDPEPTNEERKTRTIPFNTIGSNTIPISIDKILSEETPEERRIRILNKAKPTRMSEEQRKIFTYFARIPGMDAQILEAVNSVYEHAGEKTSLHGNIAIMGARGTGKSRLAHGLIVAMCKDLGMDAAKVARITGNEMNSKDPAKVVSMMAGGFLVIEDISDINAETLEKLNQAMEFRTDCMVMIIEDEKSAMRMFLKKNPQFAGKFDQTISIPVFTNDELVTFARTYATENGCKIDDMAVLALYTMIGNSQSEEEPTTISKVKVMLDDAINRATKGKRRKAVQDAVRNGKWTILHEKDFALN